MAQLPPENMGHVALWMTTTMMMILMILHLLDYIDSSELEFNDGVYVELFYEGNNTLYTEDGGDGNDGILMFNDVYEGNYTFNMYNGSSDGDLLQSGWMHSYGSFIWRIF